MANEYLKRTPTSAGNRKVWTWSGWIKIAGLPTTGGSGDRGLFSAVLATNSGADAALRFSRDGGSNPFQLMWSSSRYNVANDESLSTVPVFRDTGNWMHVLFIRNTPASSSTDRVRFYINGIEQEKTESNAISLNEDVGINEVVPHAIGDHFGQGRAFQGEMFDVFFVDGQALTPDVFGFNKEGKGYISVGSTQATDFRPGQWLPKSPRVIKTEINRRGGFGVNGFYLPLNDHKNFGADHHMIPDTIIKLNTDLPQPKVSIASTSQAGVAYTDVLRSDPYYDSLVLALPFVRGGLGTDGTSSGINTGFGDYSHVVRGTGSAKVPKLYGSVAIGNTGAYYGSSANFGDAGGDDYILVDASSDFVYGTNDWTIETWWYPTAVSRQAIYHGSYGTDWSLGIDFNGTSSDPHKLGFWASSTGSSWNIANADGGGNGICGVGVTSGQWYHIAYERHDETLSLYLNGVAVGIVTGVTASIDVTSSDKQAIGVWYNTTDMNEISGYLQDFRIYNGVAKYKGGFDVPKHYSPVGIGTFREVPDVCTNNFATWNSIDIDGSLVDGSLKASTGTSGSRTVGSTFGISSGKYYAEFYINSLTESTVFIGVVNTSASAENTNLRINSYNDAVCYSSSNGNKIIDGTSSSYGATYTNGDLIGVSINLDDDEVTFFKNGTSQGTITTKTFTGHYEIMLGSGSSSGAQVVTANFGQNPSFSGNTSAGTNTDANGRGLFKYAVPTGFLSLCEDNLPTPAIADPGEHFKCVLWTGDGNQGRSITGVGFKPDLVWIKSRSFSNNHHLFDVVRGPNRILRSSSTDEESTPGNIMPSFNTDGFTVGEDGSNNATNDDGNTFVAWCWKAGGVGVANTDGSINSTVSANQTAGFSIVSYTGTGSVGTVGHGLGKRPKVVIVKDRNGDTNWPVFFDGISNNTNSILSLDLSNATATAGNFFNGGDTTTTTFPLGTGDGQTNASGNDHIAYCWAEIEGYSKFGSYAGNGSTDGPFVYCGFKPAWVMVKRTDSTGDWGMYDSSRNSTNPWDKYLIANASDAEGTATFGDLLSNGFKWRYTGAMNQSGATYIFMAFAESPFQTANAK